jgi:hypothetical protein
MSSGAARQNDQKSNLESFRPEFNPTNSALYRQPDNTLQGATATGTGFAAPRIGALLVEAYGKAVRKQLAFSPNKVQEEYIQFLVRIFEKVRGKHRNIGIYYFRSLRWRLSNTGLTSQFLILLRSKGQIDRKQLWCCHHTTSLGDPSSCRQLQTRNDPCLER